MERIGRRHDAEHTDPERHISPLRPHDLRHIGLRSEATGADAYELERRLGHRSQRYIARYTNPPEDVAAGYVEGTYDDHRPAAAHAPELPPRGLRQAHE